MRGKDKVEGSLFKRSRYHTSRISSTLPIPQAVQGAQVQQPSSTGEK